MDWGFALGLTAITALMIGVFIYLGSKLSRAVQKHGPDSDLAISITPTGSVLSACMVAFWVICLAARTLEPESSLGAFLKDADGLAAALIGSLICFAVAAAVLAQLGYPFAKRGRHGV